jgi:hypothetical protein
MDNPVIDKLGNKRWRDANGNYHRDDGPAVISERGGKRWYLNGKFHRDDGPAIEWSDGAKSWYLNGKCHRDDGPAIEQADGENYWYLNDRYLSFDEWLHEVDMSDEAKVMMKLQHG